MNKETQAMKALTHEQLMAKVLADYTQKVIQEERRRQAIRDAAAADQQAWFEKWEATRPQGQFARWNISDRD